jgi:REP element-mobilizing transposase RayT
MFAVIMARQIRVEYANAVYHVTARGNERKAIYRDDADRQRFLETVEEAVERFGVLIHAYCLMPNTIICCCKHPALT